MEYATFSIFAVTIPVPKLVGLYLTVSPNLAMLSTSPLVAVNVKLTGCNWLSSYSDIPVALYEYSLNVISDEFKISSGFGSAVAFKKSQVIISALVVNGSISKLLALFPNQL